MVKVTDTVGAIAIVVVIVTAAVVATVDIVVLTNIMALMAAVVAAGVMGGTEEKLSPQILPELLAMPHQPRIMLHNMLSIMRLRHRLAAVLIHMPHMVVMQSKLRPLKRPRVLPLTKLVMLPYTSTTMGTRLKLKAHQQRLARLPLHHPGHHLHRLLQEMQRHLHHLHQVAALLRLRLHQLLLQEVLGSMETYVEPSVAAIFLGLTYAIGSATTWTLGWSQASSSTKSKMDVMYEEGFNECFGKRPRPWYEMGLD